MCGERARLCHELRRRDLPGGPRRLPRRVGDGVEGTQRASEPLFAHHAPAYEPTSTCHGEPHNSSCLRSQLTYLTASSMMATALWASARSIICTDFACVRRALLHLLRYVMPHRLPCFCLHALLWCMGISASAYYVIGIALGFGLQIEQPCNLSFTPSTAILASVHIPTVVGRTFVSRASIASEAYRAAREHPQS